MIEAVRTDCVPARPLTLTALLNQYMSQFGGPAVTCLADGMRALYQLLIEDDRTWPDLIAARDIATVIQLTERTAFEQLAVADKHVAWFVGNPTLVKASRDVGTEIATAITRLGLGDSVRAALYIAGRFIAKRLREPATVASS